MAAALPRPHADDVIIRRESAGIYSIGRSGTVQIVCKTLEEALQRAASFASHQQVPLWYSDGVTFARLADLTLLRKIWNEYVELPGLRLTREQAQRLWAVDADACASVLDTLVMLNFLVRGADGTYGRRTESSGFVPRRRMAKVEAADRGRLVGPLAGQR